jgi:tetratricopeptide (TPR) repeat protein
MIFQLENKQLFSRSMLWKLQRQYFEKMGADAWRFGEVPHYVTSNQRIANSYAEVVFGFYKDSIHKTPLSDHTQPLYILEAGAGSGRFGYYFVKRLHRLCEEENIPLHNFCYILSDFTTQNIDAWQKHSLLQDFFSNGQMDIALFDMTQEKDIFLQLSGKTITPGSLVFPLVFIANYVFDSIPQELYYTEGGNSSLCHISLSTTTDPAGLTAAEMLQALSVQYDHSGNKNTHYSEPWLNDIIHTYRNEIQKGYFFFPETGIRSLAHLRAFSQQGLMVITADKGSHIMEQNVYREAPQIVKHGSFSLTVNYHAFALYTATTGGVFLFPDRSYNSINTGCMLLTKEPGVYPHTHSAYRKYMDETGPDDYFALYHQIASEIGNMSLKAILAALRFSLYDSNLLGICMDRLQVLAPGMNNNEKTDTINTIADCWENYFPLGEHFDLASRIAFFCYDIDAYECAIYYFKLSTELYGNDIGALFNMAACYYQLNEIENAKIILDIVLQREPGHTSAVDLLTHILAISSNKVES